jgi:hypothetical protein
MESQEREASGWCGQLRLLAGFVALLLGLILCVPFVPGPGLPLILLGLALLSTRFGWAKRNLERVRRAWHFLRSKL